MFDVVTFGSATWDVFIKDKEIRSKKDLSLVTGKNIYFPLGSKIEIDEINFSTGGGGTNSSFSFSNQGFKTAYCGVVGNDPAGQEIENELKQNKINVSLIKVNSKKPTNHSFVLSVPGKDRTILTYKGASSFFRDKDLPEKIKSKWFYIAPLSQESALSFEGLVDYAFQNNIRVAANMGNAQINLPVKKLEKILKKIDVLILNQEEASQLSGIDYRKEKDISKKIVSFYEGIFVMTKGSKGVSVFHQGKCYRAGIIQSVVVDRTGAGDAFGSGFVSMIMKRKTIEEAVQFGSANATNCISKWGAKNGLLKKNDSYKKIKVEVDEF